METGENENKCRIRRLPIRGILTVVGGFMVHLSLGTQLTYGNTNPYLVSYIRNRTSSNNHLRYIDGIWIQACMLMGQGVSMFLGGVLEQKLGLKPATLIGSWFLSLGVLLTYITIQISYLMSVLTYGVMFGLGCGATYAIPVGAAMRWFPANRGLAGGTVFFGFGIGSVIFNQIITVFVNPDNQAPNVRGDDGETYFGQADILDRVPTLFLVLGGTYASMQLIAVFLLSNPLMKAGPTVVPVEILSMTQTSTGEPSQVWSTQSEAPSATNQSVPATEAGTEQAALSMDIPPLQMLKTRMFYCLWVLFLSGGLGGVFLVSQWKAYGQTFIQDDRFFSIVGSCASALNAVGGMFWGWLTDRYTFKLTISLLCAIFASVAYTLLAAEGAGKPFFFVWICLIYTCLSGIYGIMPTAIGRIYGVKYIGVNYGLLYTSQIFTSAASAFLGQALITQLGYHGLFFLMGGTLTVGMLISIFIRPMSPDGKSV